MPGTCAVGRGAIALALALTCFAPDAARAEPTDQDHPAQAIARYRAIIADAERTGAPSPVATKAMFAVAELYKSIALYDQAADWYERFVALDPRAPEADGALRDAVVLRLGLGEEAQAVEDVSTYLKNYGATKPFGAAAIAVALAGHHVEHEHWDRARPVLTRSMELVERSSPDLRVQAHVLLARVNLHTFNTPQAREEYAKVRALWQDPFAAEVAIRRAWPAEEERQHDRRLARALNGVGEAMAFAADERRHAEVESLKLPIYAGPADTAAVQAHLQTKVRPWFAKKRAAIESVEADLVKIVELRPVPPPKWVIKAGSTVAIMWGDFADEFRRVPIPDAWRKDRVLFHAYYDVVDAMSDSIKATRAKPAAKKCVDLAAKYQLQDPQTHACEAWLAINDKDHFHPVDELVPRFVVGPHAAEVAPFTYEGQPLRP